ncbi:Putative PAP-specific phosphatase, mitochondrial, partial [Linum grandiflorum]
LKISTTLSSSSSTVGSFYRRTLISFFQSANRSQLSVNQSKLPAMNLVYNTITHFSPSTFSRRCHHPQYSYSAAASRRRLTPVRASLPFPTQKAKYYRELEAAVAIVERACRICVDVQSSLLSIDGGIVEKKDNSPVTVADFGVQGLISYELGKLFPSIPLVAEEDSGFVRANNLVDSVVSVVNEKTSSDKPLSDDVVLEAIDRGGSAGSSFGKEPATYWVLDPIDGTKGFLKGCGALYVVGLALVVEGEIVAGIMGCPNWQNSESSSELGAVMIAHTGCGTWIKTLQDANSWSKCSVDGFSLMALATMKFIL